MKNRIIILLFVLVSATYAWAASLSPAVKVVSYDANGAVLSQGYGVMTSVKGEALVPYTVMKGASSAVLFDAKGKEHPVTLIAGASSTYDLVRVLTTGKVLGFAPISSSDVLTGTTLSLMPYSTDKKAKPQTVLVTSADDYADYKYYDVNAANEVHFYGCPLLNENGEVVALVQKNVKKEATTACAIDARFAKVLDVKSTSALDADLRGIRIARVIPESEEDAFSYLYMLARVANDSVQFMSAASQYEQQYPKSTKVLLERATFLNGRKDFSAADADLARALSLSTTDDAKAEVHATYADALYLRAAKPLVGRDAVRSSLEGSLSHAQEAYALRPDSAYLLTMANCYYALQNDSLAYNAYRAVAHSLHGSSAADVRYFAANAARRAGMDAEKVIAELQAAVDCFPRPYSAQAANYLFVLAQEQESNEQYRAAVLNYMEYEKAVGPSNLTAKFYLLRSHCEREARMYQQALDDINSALSRSTTAEDLGMLYAEQSVIYLRAGYNDEAIASAKKSLEMLPENPDCYKVIGIAYGEKGNVKLAQQNLLRAKELGDDSVDHFLNSYK